MMPRMHGLLTVALLLLFTGSTLGDLPQTKAAHGDVPINRRMHHTIADFFVRSTFAALLEDYEVGGEMLPQGNKDPRWKEHKENVDRILMLVGKEYTKLCKARGLSTQVEPFSYPPANELTEIPNFDAYHQAQLEVAMRYMDCDQRRRTFFATTGRKILDLLRAQTVGFEVTADPEDLMDMRKWLASLLDTLKSHRFLADYSVTWPKGSYKKWKDESTGSFTLWMKSPAWVNSTAYIHERENVPYADVVCSMVRAHFKSYLVDAEEVDFNPADVDRANGDSITVNFEVESLL